MKEYGIWVEGWWLELGDGGIFHGSKAVAEAKLHNLKIHNKGLYGDEGLYGGECIEPAYEIRELKEGA